MQFAQLINFLGGGVGSGGHVATIFAALSIFLRIILYMFIFFPSKLHRPIDTKYKHNITKLINCQRLYHLQNQHP